MSENPPHAVHAVHAVIENREHLLNLLGEAAEIEHNLMCCYLYGAFSLKQSLDEDLTEEELAAVKRWHRSIIGVAIDEMAHLALVANLTAAIGGAPHFGRTNFPIASGVLPAGIVVRLAPFNRDTLDHFIFLERPEGTLLADGHGFEPPRTYQRLAIPGRLMPTSHDYETVGALYRSIEEGIQRLVAQGDESQVFVGDPSHQLGPEHANLPGITRVRCLKTARAALEGIVLQGEGAPGHSEESHYQRFLDIREEYDRLLARRPAFVPGRHAAHNPVMRHPPTPEDRVYVDLEPAASLLDLVNATYTHMLRLLVQAYAETRGDAAQRAQVDAATALMYAITDVASDLTRLPASAAHPGCTAGMSFATIRGGTALPSGAAADTVLVERARALAVAAENLAPALPPGVPQRLNDITERLARDLHAIERASVETMKGKTMTDDDAAKYPGGYSEKAHAGEGPVTRVSGLPAAPAGTPPPPVPVSVIEDGVERVEGKGLTLLFEARKCIHSRHCVLEQPGVFKANVEGPWIDPDATSVESLVALAHKCPSNAIRYRRKDGVADESAPPVNLVQVRENGPLGVRAELVIDGAAVGYRATLCRCGASKRKPFCDGSHGTIGFAASGEPATQASEPLAVRSGPLEVRPQRNGPLAVSGNLELISGTGRTLHRLTTARLCRCGGSSNKPFCDGTHARNGFVSD